MRNLFTLTILTLTLTACFSGNVKDINSVGNNPNSWMEEGSLALTRKIPSVSKAETSTAFGFASSTSTNVSKPVINIDLKSSNINIKTGESLSKLDNAILNVLGKLEKQNYTLVMKQTNPTWHATDEYYINRKLPVPPIGHKDRFLKAALGSKAIFLDGSIPIHNAKLMCEETGGIVISNKAMEELYSNAETGSILTIK